MADGDGLENHWGGNVTVGSNPTPSADLQEHVRVPLRGAAARTHVPWTVLADPEGNEFCLLAPG